MKTVFVAISCIFLLSGCVAHTVESVLQIYETGSEHKALAKGTHWDTGKETVAISFAVSTVEGAKRLAKQACHNEGGLNCTITSVDGVDVLTQQKTHDKTSDNSSVDLSYSSKKDTQVNFPEVDIVNFKHVAATDTIPLRIEPTFGGRVVYQATKGEQFSPLEETGNWLLIKNKSGVEGWVRKDNIYVSDKTILSPKEKCDDSLDPQYWIDNLGRLQLQLFYKCWDYEQKKKIEQKILNIVKKIPGSSIEKNKRGYKALLVLDEKNSTYKNKVRYYSMTEGERKLMEEQRKKEQEKKRKKQEQEQKRKEKKKEQIEARKRSNIKRLYQSTEEYWKVVVAPTRRTKIKCALYDADGQVLVVDEQYVDPPLDEVIIRVPGGYGNDVESVKCWGF